MFKLYMHLFIFLLVTTTLSAQTASIEQQLDDLLAKQFKPVEPGCEILVARHGEIIYKKAFGSADLALQVPLTANMVFKLASITKQFTAVAILQLVEQGKISLQDSLQKFIPDYPYKGHVITIENLLTHTSGIRDYMQIGYRSPYMERWDFDPKELIDSFKNYALDFTPGTKFSYSNSGYYLLGYIIEKVSGKRYQTYVQDNILTPLAMTNTYFDWGDNIIPGKVNGYRKKGAAFFNAAYWSPTIAYSAGGLLSNAEDLLKWFKGILSYKIIKKETLAKAFTPFKLEDGSSITYGYGWYVQNTGQVRSIEHSGKMNGFLSNEMYYPDQDVFIVALFNCENAPRDEVSTEISEIVLGRSLQAQAIKPVDNVLNSYVGTYSLTSNPKRTIVIAKEKDRLVANVSGQQAFELLFQTPTTCQFKNVKDLVAEFIMENGNVTKLIVNQNGRFEWKKIK